MIQQMLRMRFVLIMLSGSSVSIPDSEELVNGEIDTQVVGQLAAGLMDQVSSQFGDDATVETVALVVEVRHPDDDGEATTITCRCSDERAWVHSALLRVGAQLVEREALSP